LAAANAGTPWGEFLAILAPGRGERILDIGAGDCSKAARVLHSCGEAEVYAADPNGKKIASAKRNHPDVKSSVASAERLPFPDSYFDKAYSTMALHHFADLDRALAEIARVLRPGGAYVIVEVEPHSLNGRLFRFFGRLMGEKMQIMTEDQLLKRIGGVRGFSIGRTADFEGSYLIQLMRA
jgi:ubiquinone/menaquinone biosynthesis C-methylase UbiE